MNLLLFLAVSTLYVANGDPVAVESPQTCNGIRNLDRCASEIAEREIRFSVKLYRAVARTVTGMIALSTVGAFLVSSQLYYGAEGLSNQQLGNVLNYCSDCCAADHGLQDLVYETNHLRDAGASMDNTIVHAYNSSLKESFMKKIDILFRSKPRWIEWDDIKNGNFVYRFAENIGISEPYNQTVREDESLVLVSAAKFSSGLSVTTLFPCYFLSDFYYNTSAVIVNYAYIRMTAELIFGKLYYRRKANGGYFGAQYIDLSWANSNGNKIKTFILLPNDKNGITELEKYITEPGIRKMLSNTQTRLVTATLPRLIEMNTAHNLVEPLKKMHLTEMFNETSDFKKIFEPQRIRVGPILHQVNIYHEWINVSQSCVFPYRSRRIERAETFYADHAFIILTIFNGRNPFVLSIGRYQPALPVTKVGTKSPE